MISKLPFEHEDQAISEILVPGILFSFMAFGFVWYEFYDSRWILVEVLLFVLFAFCVFNIAWQILVQVLLLKVSRQELILCYSLTEDPEEREKIKRKLADLCVSVDWNLGLEICISLSLFLLKWLFLYKIKKSPIFFDFFCIPGYN